MYVYTVCGTTLTVTLPVYSVIVLSEGMLESESESEEEDSEDSDSSEDSSSDEGEETAEGNHSSEEVDGGCCNGIHETTNQ